MAKLIHNPIKTLDADALKVIQKAKLVFALDWDMVNGRVPVTVDTFVGIPGEVTLLTTLLEGHRLASDVPSGDPKNPTNVLKPDGGTNQVLQITAPDGTVQSCFTAPRWRWIAVQMTEAG